MKTAGSSHADASTSDMSFVDRAPLVWVVVLNWNGARDTLACLASLRELQYPAARVMVVDNGSDDGSVALIRDADPDAVLIATGQNLGFARGNNIGIRHALCADAAYVWLLNNDTTVDAHALDAMVGEAEGDPNVGIVGSVQYFTHAPAKIQCWGGGRFSRWTDTPRDETKPGAKDYITAASMLIRRRVFEEIGLLDERYFFYWEDADFCRRATRHGWRVAVASGAAVRHKSGASINRDTVGRSFRSDRAHAKSSGIFVGTYAGRRWFVTAVVRIAGIVVNRLWGGQVHRLPSLLREFLQGVRVGRARGAR